MSEKFELKLVEYDKICKGYAGGLWPLNLMYKL